MLRVQQTIRGTEARVLHVHRITFGMEARVLHVPMAVRRQLVFPRRVRARHRRTQGQRVVHVHRTTFGMEARVLHVRRIPFGMEAHVLHVPMAVRRQLVFPRRVHAQNGILEQRVPLQLQVRLQT